MREVRSIIKDLLFLDIVCKTVYKDSPSLENC